MYYAYCLDSMGIPSPPIVGDGMVHHVLGQKGKKMGGGSKFSGYGTLSPAAHLFPPSTPDSASFRRECSERAESQSKHFKIQIQ